MAKTKVKGPIRPVNIKSDTATFPATVKKGVIPKLRPTVPDADITSNIIAKKFCPSSSRISNKIKILVIKIDKNIKAVALTTIGPAMVLSNTVTDFSPFKVERIDCIRMANVVVFTPPAVDPGDPPININNVIKYRV